MYGVTMVNLPKTNFERKFTLQELMKDMSRGFKCKYCGVIYHMKDNDCDHIYSQCCGRDCYFKLRDQARNKLAKYEKKKYDSKTDKIIVVSKDG